MPTPAEQVDETFTNAQLYAATATAGLTPFMNALNDAVQNNTVPTISFGWSTPTAPDVPDMPDVPVMPVIAFQEPENTPAVFDEILPGIAIDTTIPAMPALELPTAPGLSFGMVPVVPAVGAVDVPDAPTITLPDLPVFLTLETVAFGGVNMHDDWLPGLAAIPTLDIVAPTPYSYARGPEYVSEVLNKLKAVVSERLNGGTGLPAAIESALWDRLRGREHSTTQANIAEVTRTSENLGYHLPPGVITAQLREAQQNFHNRSGDLAREISIKQSELEQSNIRDALSTGMQLEGKLIDYSYQLESLSFEMAKTAAENALAIYNGALEEYRALLQGYQTYTGAFKTLIDAELSKVEVYKAQLAGEQAKADINRTLADQYKAQIEGSMATVEIFRAQVGAAQTLVELEKAKIEAAGEQIRAYVAQVNAETSKIEAYKAGVQAEAVKSDIYKTQVDAYASRAQVQGELARANISRYEAIARAKAAEWDGYSARIGAESERIRALGLQSGALLDGYKAQASAVESQAAANISLWNATVTNYQKGRDVLLSTEKINSDNLLATRAAQLDAAKAGAQVYAQLTSSAWGMIHASASVSGSGGTSVSYSYKGDVSGTVSPLPSV